MEQSRPNTTKCSLCNLQTPHSCQAEIHPPVHLIKVPVSSHLFFQKSVSGRFPHKEPSQCCDEGRCLFFFFLFFAFFFFSSLCGQCVLCCIGSPFSPVCLFASLVVGVRFFCFGLQLFTTPTQPVSLVSLSTLASSFLVSGVLRVWLALGHGQWEGVVARKSRSFLSSLFVGVCASVYSNRERQRDRQRETERDRESTETGRQRDRDGETERQR